MTSTTIEQKKAELDALALEVVNVTQDVEQFQAIVDSLTEKAKRFQSFLITADSMRAVAMDNKSLVDQLAQNAFELQKNSGIAASGMYHADEMSRTLAKKMKAVTDKLIYSADIINKLALSVTRAKALNPLISDELVSMVEKVGIDANNAVALTLVALQSTFAAQASNLETHQSINLENTQSSGFYTMLTHGDKSIQNLLQEAYVAAKEDHENASAALEMTTRQLNDAQTQLDKAQATLQSLQAQLNEANGAALT